MKLQVQQALATVLNIQLGPPEEGPEGAVQHFIRSDDPAQISLGVMGKTTLAQAVWKAMELANMEADCYYAIFPLGSNREDYYMSIEREMLRQEATEEFGGKKMWELLGTDPRELITTIMEQLRECATNVVNPYLFQTALLRTGCLVTASLQWTSDWIARLKMREAVLKGGQPKKPESLPDPLPSERPLAEGPQYAAPPVELFGAGGLKVVEEPSPAPYEVDGDNKS